MSNPRAVIISDVHYNINTLELADKAVRTAMAHAKQLGVPFIVTGDLHDTKASMRGECVEAMMRTFEDSGAYVLVGNHDRLNERSSAHSLQFLKPLCTVIDSLTYLAPHKFWFIPYEHDLKTLDATLRSVPKGSTVFMHQGVQTAYLGHYVQDLTSLPPERFDGYRVVSGHYHRRQDIKCGETGLFSYVGNPFTLTFGEASDGPKGYVILKDDCSLELVPLNLRKHVIISRHNDGTTQHYSRTFVNSDDFLWVKLHGPREHLLMTNKAELGQELIGHENFRLDLIPTDDAPPQDLATDGKESDAEVLELLIQNLPASEAKKLQLVTKYRELLCEN